MKRLLIRVSALATVVALGLGLIAIAKAQFGMEKTDRPAQTSQPRTLPSVTEANPLRPPSRKTGTFGSFSVIPASAAVEPTEKHRAIPVVTEPQSVPARSALSDSAPSSPSIARPPSDSFSLGRATNTADDTGENFPSSPPAAGTPSHPVLANPMRPAPTTSEGRPFERSEPPLAGDGRSIPATTALDSTASLPLEPSPAVAQDPRSQPFGSFSGERMASRPRSADPASLPSGMAPPAALPAAQGTGRPGDKQLEGPQTPQLTIEKTAPQEIQVGKPATFVVRVRNTGKVAAHGVEIRDEIPRGTELRSTNPRASRGARGELVFELGVLEPDEEVSVEVVLMPVEEGEIGSVATVRFNAAASVRTVCTRPQLALKTTIPRSALLGSDVTISITISNPGSGVATGVVLEEHIPAGLDHPAGDELEYEIGDLAPNESREVNLVMKAGRPGKTTNLLIARADANLEVVDRKEIEVTAPQLIVGMEGPKRRYLEREAVYKLAVSNPGTAPAHDVELLVRLPDGMNFVSANNHGNYDEATRTVRWNLDELPVQMPNSQPAFVQLTMLPVEPGQQIIRFSTSDESGLSAEMEHPVLVEGIAAINFEVVDVDDPVEVGGETTYEIRVVNQGSKAATNVQLVTHLSPQMQFIAAEGPVRHRVEPGRILFEPLPRLAPKADTTYRIRVQAIQPGDARLRVELTTDEIRTPVLKEESTRIYSDE